MPQGAPARHDGALSASTASVRVRITTVVSVGFSSRVGTLRATVVGVRDDSNRPLANRLSVSDRRRWPCTFSWRPYAFHLCVYRATVVAVRRVYTRMNGRRVNARNLLSFILRRVHVIRRRYVITAAAAAALVVGVISSHIRVPTPERRHVIPTVFAVVLNSAPPTKHTAKLHFICRVRRAIVVSACKPSVPLFRRKVRRTRVYPTIPDRGRHHHSDMHVTAVSHSCILRRVKHKSILETDNSIMCSFIK